MVQKRPQIFPLREKQNKSQDMSWSSTKHGGCIKSSLGSLETFLVDVQFFLTRWKSKIPMISIPKTWPDSLNSGNHLGSFNINFHLCFPILRVDFTLRLLSPGLSLSRTPGPCSSCSSLQCASQSVQLRTREKNQTAGGKREADCWRNQVREYRET